MDDPSRLKVYPVGITNDVTAFGQPKFSILVINLGNTASELAVVNAKINSSFKIFIRTKTFVPAIFAIIPNTTKTKKIMVRYITSTNFPKGINEPIPNFATFKPIKANTPNGANFITKFVIQNMDSSTPSKKFKTGLPFSPIAATPRPNKT